MPPNQVFVAFAEPDESAAHDVITRLERERFPVWNPLGLSPGLNWQLEAGQALARSNSLVVLISPEALRSSRFRSVVDYSLVNAQFAHSVWPVVVKPTPSDAIPWILKGMSLIDMVADPARGLDQLVRELRNRQAGPASAT